MKKKQQKKNKQARHNTIILFDTSKYINLHCDNYRA